MRTYTFEHFKAALVRRTLDKPSKKLWSRQEVEELFENVLTDLDQLELGYDERLANQGKETYTVEELKDAILETLKHMSSVSIFRDDLTDEEKEELKNLGYDVED